ncbi:MAG: integrase/recombinase XerD [Thermosipho sp. (in: thermotogales)]|nr:integrase/recombinase XerD [Thermosipho sp. (in: thermotogales)]MDN5325007.1 integrase/recombinase XerD [Thermosipho sp. (in: thermotogales)]
MEELKNKDLKRFIEYLNTQNISENTKKNYITMLESFLNFVNGKITVDSVKRWLDYIRNNYKHTAWRQYFVPLRSFLQRFYPTVFSEVVEDLKVPYKKADYEMISYLDFWKLYRAAEKMAQKGNEKYVLLVGLAGIIGLKSGDIVNLKGTDIKDGKIYVRAENLVYDILPPLDKWLEKYEGKNVYLISTADGKPVKPSYLALMLRGLQKKVDIKLNKPLSVEILRNVAVGKQVIAQPSLPYVMDLFKYNSTKTIEDIARYIAENGDLRTILSIEVVDDLAPVIEFFNKLSIPIRKIDNAYIVSRTVYIKKGEKFSRLNTIFVVRNIDEWQEFIESLGYETKRKPNENYFLVLVEKLRVAFVEYEEV